MGFPIYLDYCATTPVDPEVSEAMIACLQHPQGFGNPSSRSHYYGLQASQQIERARRQVSDLINAKPQEIIWTSGATEANNLALQGLASNFEINNCHIISSKIEHSSILNVCQQLQQRGARLSYLATDQYGLIDSQQLLSQITENTRLVSLSHVNNEIGVIQNIQAIGRQLRQRGILFHVDAVQSVGKLPINVKTMNIDLMSLSAHKVYGPKGIGALYIREDLQSLLSPQLYGGGQEFGLRSGTLATHQIIGMGTAFKLAKQKLASESQQLMLLRNRLWNGLKKIEAVVCHGSLEHRIASNLNVGFKGIKAETLMMACPDIAVSSGSACYSMQQQASHVLMAIGCSETLAQSSIRFSLGRFTTAEEIDQTIELVTEKVKQLRSLAKKNDYCYHYACP